MSTIGTLLIIWAAVVLCFVVWWAIRQIRR